LKTRDLETSQEHIINLKNT